MRIHLQPGTEYKLADLPADSIALDGAVQGPSIDAESRRYSFDHHAGCVRLATSATCQQALDAILLGLDPTEMTIYINDVDGDVVLSVWLLLNHARWRDAGNLAAVRPLVMSVGGIDAHGTAYRSFAPELAHHFYEVVLEPLRGLDPRDGDRARKALDTCIEALETWWDAGFEMATDRGTAAHSFPIEDYGDFALVDLSTEEEADIGNASRALYDAGWDRLIVAHALPGGRFGYLLAKRSDLVAGFQLLTIYRALNVVEAETRGAELGSGQTWGGGSSVGGSPRDGSVLAPKVVVSTIRAKREEVD